MRTTFFLLTAFITHAALAEELWVGSYTGDHIKRYDLTTGTLIGPVEGGHLNGPLGMSLGPDGKVYATSELTGSVETFAQDGSWKGRFATASSPTAIAFRHDKSAFVAEFDTDSVSWYAPDGTPKGTFVTAGSGGLDGPDLGTVFGPDGDLYVPSFWSGAVLRYDGATGASKGAFVVAGSGGLSQPRQMLWRGPYVYVSSDNGNRVLRYDGTSGAFVDTFVTTGSGGLNGASGMAFYGDSLYVTSWRNNRILRYDAATGAFQGAFVTTGLSGPVSLLVVPEPASLMALTAAGTALLKRRRSKP
ncbi:MAG: PEP-CTERM sorting domain-containing protein [Armatimonadetes bacterium]|nr:PEP-CTERM sorting domain-containing protein [Armatimonadota bacterium]